MVDARLIGISFKSQKVDEGVYEIDWYKIQVSQGRRGCVRVLSKACARVLFMQYLASISPSTHHFYNTRSGRGISKPSEMIPSTI